MTVCETCGVSVQIGDWPFCPHGSAKNFGEQPLEPYDDFNLTTGTVRVTTRAERRAIMSKNHLEYVPKLPRRGSRTYIDMAKR